MSLSAHCVCSTALRLALGAILSFAPARLAAQAGASTQDVEALRRETKR